MPKSKGATDLLMSSARYPGQQLGTLHKLPLIQKESVVSGMLFSSPPFTNLSLPTL